MLVVEGGDDSNLLLEPFETRRVRCELAGRTLTATFAPEPPVQGFVDFACPCHPVASSAMISRSLMRCPGV